MRVRTFFRNYMLIPVIMIPFLTIAFFLLTWQGGLHMSLDKDLLPLVFALPVAISFVVVGIVVIVRRTRKRPVRLLLQVLVIELLVVPAFFLMNYDHSTWTLNQHLYQDDRLAFVKRIQSPNLSGEEKVAMDTLLQHRNWPMQIALHGSEEHLQNSRRISEDGTETISTVTVMRDCDGNLTVQFTYDGEFFGADYSILYSDKNPVREEITSWDKNGIPRHEVNYRIDGYTVLDTISTNWYYVQHGGSWTGLFNFGGGGGGGWSSGCQPISGHHIVCRSIGVRWPPRTERQMSNPKFAIFNEKTRVPYHHTISTAIQSPQVLSPHIRSRTFYALENSSELPEMIR